MASELFRLAREFVEQQLAHWQANGEPGGWLILSAKHHLLDPEKEIEPYDDTLYAKTTKQRWKWANKVLGQLMEYCHRRGFKPSETCVTILAGLIRRIS